LGEYHSIFITDKIIEKKTFDFDYSKYITLFTTKKTELNSRLVIKIDLLTNLATQEIEIKNKIAELKDRKFISTKIDEIKKAIENHKII